MVEGITHFHQRVQAEGFCCGGGGGSGGDGGDGGDGFDGSGNESGASSSRWSGAGAINRVLNTSQLVLVVT